MSTVSLPSLESMFPEHLFRVPPDLRVKGSEPPRFIPSFPPPTNGKRKASSSFHVLRSDANSSSISFRHIVHSGPSTLRHHSPSHTSDSTTTSSEGEGDEDLENTSVPSGRRHVCKLCGKCFNRPSSLKIHENTHTGAKPFPCPFPGCGRQFNVNSNMRRHYRSHMGMDKAGASLSGSPGTASASDPKFSSQKRQVRSDRERSSSRGSADSNELQTSKKLKMSRDNLVDL
ncbi:uncharacterized protein EV420DRAFT_1183411 [Desarmillaria tabescens]|uniref:C2H2-type domain-containing protein n=1 Tax=Armillaria tabescens TaxID=1929756 RepID=A0AA39NB87_ARMTA|nr:uncharacterized protein EV420DRAFT_1183411 [Desarmillaria tabescens]KAK0462364.1 hypothetical protein EV420DRAFT_1183411 [Desarmillaria tabescens]